MKLLRGDFRDLIGCDVLLDGDNDGGNNEGKSKSDDATTGDKGEKSDKKTFTQEEVGKLLSDERKAERKKAADEFEQKRKDDEAAAEQKKKDDEAKARGEFEQVESKLRSEIETLKADKSALEERVKKLDEAVAKTVDDEWTKLPEEVREGYSAAGGSDEDALAKMNYLPTARKLAEKISGERKEVKKGTEQNPDPKGTDNGKGTLDQDLAAARSSGQYRPM